MDQTGSSILGQEKKGDHSSNSLLLCLLVPDFDPDTQGWKNRTVCQGSKGRGKVKWGWVAESVSQRRWKS